MKKVKESKRFEVPGTFESMYAAQAWLKEKGYDYGSNSAGGPTAVMKGRYWDYDLPQKMKNFTEREKNLVHGIMTGNLREGPVIVHLYE